MIRADSKVATDGGLFKCMHCTFSAQDIGNGHSIRAFGHADPKAEWIHAICLTCFRSSMKDATRLRFLKQCFLCDLKFSDLVSKEDASPKCIVRQEITVGSSGSVEETKSSNIMDEVKFEALMERRGRKLGPAVAISGGVAAVAAAIAAGMLLGAVLKGWLPKDKEELGPILKIFNWGKIVVYSVTGVVVITKYLWNPAEEMMGRAGYWTGRCIVRASEAIDDLVPRVKNTWNDMVRNGVIIPGADGNG